MKIRNLIIPVLLLGFILNLLLSPSLAARKKVENIQEDKPIFIPKEVKSIFNEGIKTREARLDIPFIIIKHLYLPAQDSMHSIFIFKVKNADLGFSPIAPAQETPEKKEGEEQDEEVPPESEIAPTKLQANSHVFLQFNRLEEKAPGEMVKEIYVPVNLQVDSGSYEPDKEELYTTAYPLLPGDYVLSMAIASEKLERIGTQYFEFSLPNPFSFTDTLDTTPIFFVKSMKRMASAELKAKVHKGFFTYSVLQIEANVESIFSPGDNFELLFYILGTQPLETGKYDIEVEYEILEGEEKVIRFAPGNYDVPIIGQPLHLKRTVLIKSAAGERKEFRDLEPGKYVLSIKVTDKVSGNSIEKSVDFDVK